MDTFFDGKPIYSDKEFYGIALASTKNFSNVAMSALKELIEEDKRIQEKAEKNQLESRQSINNFLRNMIKWVKFDGDWTVVKWFDGKITRVKKQPGETYSKEVGLLWCIAKKMFYQNPNILFEVMREFVGEDPHEPTAAVHEVTDEDVYDKDIMKDYLNRLTYWALDVTNALAAEGEEKRANDMYDSFAEIRSDMQDEYGVSWI